MTSKLISLAPFEAPNQLELSLREAFGVLLPKLTPPLKVIVPSTQEYLNLNKAILYGVLCEPNLAKPNFKYLHAIVDDGYSFFINLLAQIVDELYAKMLEVPKVQLIWVASVMVDVAGVGYGSVLVSILRQIIGGDFTDGNLWLSHEMVNLFLSKWDLILDEEPVVLTRALYSYLRLLADHYRLPHNQNSAELKRKEIGFCVRMLREQFPFCLRIGRDLIRLLQDLVHIPEFRALWKDLVLNPASFGFSDISHIYTMRTSSSYFSLRITPEMETQLRFLLTHVELGAQNRHQVWFARKFLFVPERETLVCDIVRFICCGYHPSNEVLHSDVTPRWALIGWLLASCTKKYVEASVKLALFYDYLFFDEKVDDVMNIEPAMLLMVNSIPRYIDMTQSLLEFLLLLVDKYDFDRKHVILKGVTSALSTLVTKGVIISLDVLSSCNLLPPFLRKMLHDLMSTTSNTQPCPKPISPETMVGSASLIGCSNVIDERRVDDLATLIGKIGENMKKSNKMGCELVERILLLFVNPMTPQKSGEFNPEFVASKIKKELELANYKLFSPLESLLASVDDEVESVTTVVIRSFIFSQNQNFTELLLSWSRSGLPVRERVLSYVVRLAYEAQVAGHGDNFSSEINYDSMTSLLKSHLEGYITFLSRSEVDASGRITSASKVDKKFISRAIDGAFSSYRIMFKHSMDGLSNISLSKLLLADVTSCSLWKNKNLRVLFQIAFSFLSDIFLGDENMIMLLVSQLDQTDIVSVQIDLTMKKFSIFGEDVQNVLQVVRKSICWGNVEQYKFWGLIRSELSVCEFPVEKLLLDFFFSDDLDPKTNGIATEGLMILCSCRVPTPELVGAVMLLPNNKFPDFVAAILSHWMMTNASMLFNNIDGFLDKLQKKNEDMPLDLAGILINHSAILFLLKYLEEQGPQGVDMREKISLNLSGMKTMLENPTVAMDTG